MKRSRANELTLISVPCLEANRFICHKLMTLQKSDDGLQDETASFELGVALARVQWVATAQSACRLAKGETCCNTYQQKSHSSSPLVLMN